MKKILLAFCMVALLASCSKNSPWEYKVVKVAGKPAETLADYGALVYGDQTAMLNKMGKEGWELVSITTNQPRKNEESFSIRDNLLDNSVVLLP